MNPQLFNKEVTCHIDKHFPNWSQDDAAMLGALELETAFEEFKKVPIDKHRRYGVEVGYSRCFKH
jgi:hypothetical protein